MSTTDVRTQFLSSVFIVPQKPVEKPFPHCMLQWIMSNAFIWGQLPSILFQQSLAVYLHQDLCSLYPLGSARTLTTC